MRTTVHKTGLTKEEVKQKLSQFGPNEIEENKLANFLENLAKILLDPMGLMLLTLAGIYWFLEKSNDAIILSIAYIPIISIDVLLELRSQKALRALKQSLKSTCHVIRDGVTTTISVKNLVPGDILVVEEGQTLPADGIILECANLTIDESVLTGESIPISKKESEEALSGTTVLTGSGLVEIQKTGISSQMGVIAKALRDFEATPSPLLTSIRRTVKWVFLIAIALGVLVFINEHIRGNGLGQSLISSLTLAMAAIPEEFPLVFTLFLSLAAYRLSKKGILVKSLPAVEGLGRVQTLCTDKTGTLTEGQFQLNSIVNIPGFSEQDKDLQNLALVLSCEMKAVDAMESAIFQKMRVEKGADFIDQIHAEWDLQFDYAFNLDQKYMCHIWKNRRTQQQFIAMKGSTEGVLRHCGFSSEHSKILEILEQQSNLGQRLLGLAGGYGVFTGQREEDEKNIPFIALLCFTDPVRPSAAKAVEACGIRGIELKMLTGDHLLTAHAVAHAVNLPHTSSELFSGPQLESMSPEQKILAYRNGKIFARLRPDQKLELVKTLKSDGKIVAMTGDGVNDAPALKIADIGISMGERATDVARSSAQMILLNNDFSGIVSSIIEGQRVLQSLAQSFGYLIAFHIPIVGIALVQSFFLTQNILSPIHIVLMELIVHPISAFVFTATADSTTHFAKGLFSKQKLIRSSIRGVLLGLLSVGVPLYFQFQSPSFSILTLVASNIGLIVGELGGWTNWKTYWQRPQTWASVFTILVLTGTLCYVPTLNQLFLISPLSLQEVSVLSLIAILMGFL